MLSKIPDLVLEQVARAMDSVPVDGPVLVGVSGGGDSVALCLALIKLGYDVRVAHLDHGARPDSMADAEWVERWAVSRGIPVHCERTVVTSGSGFEERAREIRLTFLQAAAQQFGCRVVALGHHLDDQAETVLFRLARGSGPSGLGGIQAQRHLDSGVLLIHPLLRVRRADLQACLRFWNQDWREDPTNLEPSSARNVIRHHVLPQLTNINSAASRHVAEAAAVFQDEDQYWMAWFSRVAPFYGRSLGPGCLEVPRAPFLALSEVERQRLLWGWWRQHRWPGRSRHSLQRLAAVAELGGAADLGAGLRCYVHKEVMVVEMLPETPVLFPLVTLGVQPTAHWGWKISLDRGKPANRDRFHCSMPREALGQDWVWRSAIPLDDQFLPEGRHRSRSLRHWLNRQGVPPHHQQHLLVLARAQEVQWVVGYAQGAAMHRLENPVDCVQMQATTCFQV